MPWTDDWKMVMPSTPVNVKPMKLKPAAWPRLSCAVVPNKNMSRNGNRNDPISRVRSRRNLSRSRAAMAAMALSSFIGKNPEIDIVEARLPRPQHGERCLELAHEGVRRPAIQGDMEPSVFVEGHVETHELAPQRYPVRGGERQRLPAALR